MVCRFSFSNFSCASLERPSLKCDLFLYGLGFAVNIMDCFGVILEGEVLTVLTPGQLVEILIGCLVVSMANLLQKSLSHCGDRVRAKWCNCAWLLKDWTLGERHCLWCWKSSWGRFGRGLNASPRCCQCVGEVAVLPFFAFCVENWEGHGKYISYAPEFCMFFALPARRRRADSSDKDFIAAVEGSAHFGRALSPSENVNCVVWVLHCGRLGRRKSSSNYSIITIFAPTSDTGSSLHFQLETFLWLWRWVCVEKNNCVFVSYK